jgi:concanavalin A-like lectin/glucanase superfamily protein
VTGTAACADGKDNDGDGKVDLADPGCSSSTDDSESPDPAPAPAPAPSPDPTPAPAPAPDAAALVGAWGFGETSGSWALDSSGKGNDGAIMGATRTKSGKYGRALAFNGKSNYVKVADSPSLDLSSGMTLEAWVYPNATSGSRTVVFKENLGTRHETYALYAGNNTGKPTTEVATGPTYTTLDGSTLLTAKTWTHIAATYDGTTLKIYRNGVLVGSRPLTGGLVTTSDPLKFGGNAVWGEWFNGTIDEVRVYNAARSATQVQSDMTTPIPAPGTATAAKVGGTARVSAKTKKTPRACVRAAKVRAKKGKHSRAARKAARACKKAKARLRRAG